MRCRWCKEQVRVAGGKAVHTETGQEECGDKEHLAAPVSFMLAALGFP